MTQHKVTNLCIIDQWTTTCNPNKGPKNDKTCFDDNYKCMFRNTKVKGTHL